MTATVFSYSVGDVLDVYYAPSAAAPSWTLVGTVRATKSMATETLTLTFPLAGGAATQQAIPGGVPVGREHRALPDRLLR